MSKKPFTFENFFEHVTMRVHMGLDEVYVGPIPTGPAKWEPDEWEPDPEPYHGNIGRLYYKGGGEYVLSVDIGKLYDPEWFEK